MKVICINDTGIWAHHKKYFWGLFKRYMEDDVGPKYMEVCVVIEEEEDGYYILEGYDPDDSFAKTEFIPLSENREVSYEKVKTNVPMHSN